MEEYLKKKQKRTAQSIPAVQKEALCELFITGKKHYLQEVGWLSSLKVGFYLKVLDNWFLLILTK